MFFKNLSIKTKLLIIFLLVGITPFAIIGTVSLMKSTSTLTDQSFEKLKIVQEIKKAQIEEYYMRCLSDIKVIANNFSIIEALDKFQLLFSDTESINEMGYNYFDGMYGMTLKLSVDEYDYNDLLLIQPTGRIVYSAKKNSDLGKNVMTGELQNTHLGKAFQAALNGIVLTDFGPYPHAEHGPVAFILAPVKIKDESLGDLKVVGVVAYKLDNSPLNSIVHRRDGMGKTGDTFIVGKSGKTVSFRTDPIEAGIKHSMIYIDEIFSGKSGAQIYSVDNKIQLVAYCPLEIKGLEWFIVSKIDRKEAFAAVDILKIFIGIIGFFGIVCITLVSLVVTRSITRRVISLASASEQFAKGNLHHSIDTSQTDELGTLARSFADMGDSINSQIKKIKTQNRELKDYREQLEQKIELIGISEEKFRGLVESTSDLIWEVNNEGIYTYASPQVESILGYNPAEVIGISSFEMMSPDESIRVEKIFRYLTEKKTNIVELENKCLHKDGHEVVLETSGVPFFDEYGNCVGYRGIDRDITLRKNTEIALAQEKERLLVTLRSIGDGVITTNVKGQVTLVNTIAEKLTGWTQKDAFGKDIKEIFNIINSETGKKGENPVEKVLEAKTIVGLAKHTDLISRDGTKHIIADSGAPILDSNNDIIGVVLVFRDETENQKIETQLQQSQKMEAIGTLAGGIAHDFNNLLGVIIGNLSYALSSLNKNDELYELLTDIQESSRQAQGLTNQLLTFSRGGAPIKKTTDVNKIINDAAIFSSRGAKSKPFFQLSGDLWPADVDEGQINQVVSNLIINANQAMPNGGTITIITQNVTIETGSSIPLPAGLYIKIIVEDQGIGISEEHLSNIFDPYFTTKQKGNGLGLATVYSIIKKHDGHIAVYSEIGRGTVFNIYLPSSSEDINAIQDNEEQKHAGQGKILIMDDQESILKMVTRLLNKMGYEVASVTDGTQAINIYREAYDSGKPFDLAILDLTVPGGMGGAETIHGLRNIDPNVRAIVSSGYSNDPIMANYQDYGFCGVIPKPYTKGYLAEVLNKIFDEKNNLFG